MRIRQLAFATHDLAAARYQLFALLGLDADFSDPGVAEFGLHNSVVATGTSFLEIVSPFEGNTAVSRMLGRMHGDCGYMAIVQVPDVALASQSMSVQGTRRGIVSGDWNVCPGSPGSGLAGVESGRYVMGEPLPKEPDTVSGANVQFHPRDFGTLAEIQENWPNQSDFPRNKGAYFPAGNTWQNRVDARPHGGVTTGFAAVEIASREGDPEEVCQRWLNGLGAGCSIDPGKPTTLNLSGGQTMRFVEPEPGGRTGVIGVDLWAAPGAYRKFDAMVICGVKWTLVDQPNDRPSESETS